MENKLHEEFLKLFNKIEDIDTIDLLDYLRMTDYFTAPSSSRFHNAKEGGNVEHSINVTKFALDLNKKMELGLSEKSIVIVGLFHDLGKCEYYNEPSYIKNILKSGKQSEAKPYTSNPERKGIPHEVISIQIISEFISLEKDELFAILHHNGMYGDLKYQLQGNETKLQTLIHFADMWASRFLEERV